MYRVGICDDIKVEAHVARLYVKDYAERHDYQCSVKEFYTAKDMEKYLQKEELDIVFLDIDLNGDEESGNVGLSKNNGIALARTFRNIYPDLVIVFITGHREFTAHAFDVEAMGYIMKPIDRKKLDRVLKKCILQVNALRSEEENGEIIITEGNMKKKLKVAEIIRIERQQRKTKIITVMREHYVIETLVKLEEQLDGKFLRISQSDLINPAKVVGIEKNKIQLRDGTILNIGRTYLKQVKERYFSK